MSETSIQWTDVTDNIIVAAEGGWWCRKISDGCKNCYAAKLNQSSYFGGNHLPYSGLPPDLKLRTEIIHAWANQRKAKKHFVESMSDVFGEWVPRNWIWLYLDGMVRAPRQTFQVLTKRSDVMLREVVLWLDAARGLVVPEHIWVGVSVENRATLHRVDDLRRVPATTRFLSIEPLLEDVGTLDLTGIHWVIVGGESGPGARPCNVEWIESIVEQCRAANVPVFVKQLGAKPVQNGQPLKLDNRKGGEMDEWPGRLRIRQFPDEGRTKS
jgi:protein gp37